MEKVIICKHIDVEKHIKKLGLVPDDVEVIGSVYPMHGSQFEGKHVFAMYIEDHLLYGSGLVTEIILNFPPGDPCVISDESVAKYAGYRTFKIHRGRTDREEYYRRYI